MSDTTPDRCKCGGSPVCDWCGRIMPSHYVTALLDHIDKLEKVETVAQELAKMVVQGFEGFEPMSPQFTLLLEKAHELRP